jgi:hypothetical protein
VLKRQFIRRTSIEAMAQRFVALYQRTSGIAWPR